MSAESKIELLWNGAKTLQNGKHVHKLLKSYYINTCRKLAKNSLQIPKEKFAVSQMCPHCGSFWSDADYGLKLIPKQIKCRSRTKRLIENFERANETTSKALNKSSRNRAKWLKKKIQNHLAINCYHCQHSSLLDIENPKWKSRDQLPNLKNKSKETCTIDSGNISIEHQQQKGKESKHLTSAPSKSKKVKQEEKSTKISACKNKRKLSTSSKTQKKNSLVQLAALLQKQPKVDVKASAKKGLQSFLK